MVKHNIGRYQRGIGGKVVKINYQLIETLKTLVERIKFCGLETTDPALDMAVETAEQVIKNTERN